MGYTEQVQVKRGVLHMECRWGAHLSQLSVKKPSSFWPGCFWLDVVAGKIYTT